MNADAPRRSPCEGVRSVHVLRGRDTYQPGDRESPTTAWNDPPVRIVNSDAKRAPVGHLEIWVCRSCGLTEWTARAWAPEHVTARCVASTTQATLAAVDRIRNDDHAALGLHPSFERFQPSVCQPCGSLEWYGHGLDAVVASKNVGLSGSVPQMATTGGPCR